MGNVSHDFRSRMHTAHLTLLLLWRITWTYIFVFKFDLLLCRHSTMLGILIWFGWQIGFLLLFATLFFFAEKLFSMIVFFSYEKYFNVRRKKIEHYNQFESERCFCSGTKKKRSHPIEIAYIGWRVKKKGEEKRRKIL